MLVSMRSLMITVVLAAAACVDEPTRAAPPPPPPPGEQGLLAVITVDNMTARPGQTVRVSVEVRAGAGAPRVGSYTGRLRFNPAQLQYQSEIEISDGMRVSNPAGATAGEIRFAGANATGFTNLALYTAKFTVRGPDYVAGLALHMDEMSAARSLTSLSAQLRTVPQVQLAAPPRPQ